MAELCTGPPGSSRPSNKTDSSSQPHRSEPVSATSAKSSTLPLATALVLPKHSLLLVHRYAYDPIKYVASPILKDRVVLAIPMATARISRELARMVMQAVGDAFGPSPWHDSYAFQFRMGGAKGVAAIDTQLEGSVLCAVAFGSSPDG